MLTGHDIIYLAGHDFGVTGSRVSTDHIADRLAVDNRLLYVESVGLRTPGLNTRDVARVGRKVSRFFRHPRRVGESFWVTTPLAFPWHGGIARRINAWLLLLQIRWAARHLGFQRPILFIFLPSMAGAVGRLGEAMSVYYCTDEHAAFPGVDGRDIRQAEEELLRKVDVVFATSRELAASKKAFHSRTFYSPHGVEFAHFARAADPGLNVPEEIRSLPHPVIGFFGAIEHWVDIGLIEALARARRSWTFVMIGQPVVDISALSSLPNVFVLGPKPFSELPRYGRAFDAAIIPFRVNDLTSYVSPIKLKEYLAMGKPVVATPLPSVVAFAQEHGYVGLAADLEPFLEAIELAVREDSRELVRARQNLVRHDTWEQRVAEIGEIVEARLAGAGKRSHPSGPV